MTIWLRKRKPFTCRQVIAGKVCADYLTDEDGDLCKLHQAAKDKFFAGPESKREAEEPVVVRRVWP